MFNDYPATILIVDDKAKNIFALEEILARPGRNFVHAADGQEALKTVLNKEIDLVILDVQMPGMDGFEVARVLKSNKRTKEIPIIFASAEKKEQRHMMKGFEEGAVDYLYKPLDPAVTEAKVSVLLQLHLGKKELVRAHEEIRQLNAELKQKILQLENINKELESFSYSVSHDLRGPLRSINGYARMILEDYSGKLDDELRRLLNIIHGSAGKMGVLIDSLLEFSRLGRKSLKRYPVDITHLVQRALQDQDESLTRRIAISVDRLPPAEGDPVLLSQVVVNLLSNAIKYTGKKEDPRIEVGSFDNEEEHVYFVKDNGAGFDMSYAHKLFGVFQRLHGSDEFEGTGVGLATVQRIVAKHGGRVWAKGQPGEGATFYFSLPKIQGQ